METAHQMQYMLYMWFSKEKVKIKKICVTEKVAIDVGWKSPQYKEKALCKCTNLWYFFCRRKNDTSTQDLRLKIPLRKENFSVEQATFLYHVSPWTVSYLNPKFEETT